MHRPIVSCLKTSMYRHEPQGLIWFCPCMFFFTLKAVGPIDCHYMTDRLQRFELKIFVCVLLKKQSHLHLGCPGGKQINIKFKFLGELSLWEEFLLWINHHICMQQEHMHQLSCTNNMLFANRLISPGGGDGCEVFAHCLNDTSTPNPQSSTDSNAAIE